MPAFLLDENIDIRVEKFLKAKGFDVNLCVRGATDTEVFERVNQENLILITLDQDFANTDIYQPATGSAIVIMRIHPPKLDNLCHALGHFLSSFDLQQIDGKTIVVSSQSAEIIEF